MSYETLRNERNEIIVMPLELPMYTGDASTLGKQAMISLSSCLRHFAVVDALDDNELIELDAFQQHFEQGTSQLVSCFLSLAGLADSYGIDIMKEIWEMPWQV